ncbi:MAG: hypothetical protein P1U61_00390 [Legionellaceae bacterium]|nr:hypothetical protein [Legionellaceae bacterium]
MSKYLKFKRAAGSALKFMLGDVNDNNRPASYAEFLASLKQDESFRVMLSETMNQQGLKGFYWECVPVSWSTLSLMRLRVMAR